MALNRNLKHIKVDRFATSEKYKPAGTGIGGNKLFKRDREIHGRKLLAQVQQIREDYESIKLEGAEQGLINDEVIYVDFYSAFNYEILFDRLNSKGDKLKFKLLNIVKEKLQFDDATKSRFRVTLVLAKGGIEEFVKKINDFITKDTKEKRDEDGNLTKEKRPLNEDLLNNIEDIKRASLKSLWSESSGVEFPEPGEIVWWEVWFRRRKGHEAAQIKKIEQQLETIGAEISQHQLTFPEHIIRLVKASPEQLSQSLMLLDNLAELRKPMDTAEFFTTLSIQEKEDWTKDLLDRVEKQIKEDSVAICLLDTGVNRLHPLLEDFLPESNLHSWNPSWGNSDSHSGGGHGTGMASLCLYGDLTAALSSMANIKIFHQLESVKIFNHKDPNDPKLYGSITIEACSTPVIDYPNRLRVYCLAITAQPHVIGSDNEYWGRPSSWSSAVDAICFGQDDKNLVFVSAGNVYPETKNDYQTLNESSSVHDPGQAFNAITVGGYTEYDKIDLNKYPNHEVIAPKGNLSPSSSTSLFWVNKWPIKPDVVMEAGNYAHSNGEARKLDSLQLLATHKDFRTAQFQTFGDTSGAAALGAKMAAELRVEYPTLWPETIRALIIHSADWTSEMRRGKEVKDLNQDEKRIMLRKFGYGVPDLNRARYSALNALTLIAENEMIPYEKVGAEVKYKEFHLYELPWPKSILQSEVFDNDCIITATLSYFIEPNPGNRIYSNSFSYQSHGLGFRVIDKDERKDTFVKRISAETRTRDKEGKLESGFNGEPWLLGSRTRERGSVQKDFLVMSGADMALRNTIAVFPKGGWYKARVKEERYNTPIRYSLIISIETPTVDVDLYNPVLNVIPNPIIL